MESLPKSKLSHNLRYTEMQASMEMNMPIDDWYTLPVEAREQMVASMLANRWVDNISVRESKQG